MAVKRDNIHLSLRTVNGYNKPFTAVISEREAGKSTCLWLDLVYGAWSKGFTSMVIKRQINDITDIFLMDSEKIINKFNDDPIKVTYKRTGLKEGIIDVFIEGCESRPLFRCVALSNPVSRLKSLMLPSLKYIVFDEFICNPKFKEKYLPDEATRFKELFNTFQRESSGIRCYWFGNPYSLYNPYFLWWGVDTSKLKPGAIIAGSNYVIQCYTLTEELKGKILERNPLYQFDDSYRRYAFNGIAVNDENIRVRAELPLNYRMRFVFRHEGKFIAVFQNSYVEDMADKYYCMFVDSVSARRCVYCFDFSELVNHTALMSREDSYKFNAFKIAMRKRNVEFSSINVYYMIEEIYYNL